MAEHLTNQIAFGEDSLQQITSTLEKLGFCKVPHQNPNLLRPTEFCVGEAVKFPRGGDTFQVHWMQS
jgi:hypothetical protein